MSDSVRFLKLPKDNITGQFHVTQVDTSHGETLLALGLGPDAAEGYLLVGSPEDFEEVIAAIQRAVARARGEDGVATAESTIVRH